MGFLIKLGMVFLALIIVFGLIWHTELTIDVIGKVGHFLWVGAKWFVTKAVPVILQYIKDGVGWLLGLLSK